MKEIKAVIRPGKLPALREALHQIADFPGMTVVKAEGCSGNTRHASRVSLSEELTDYTPKVMVWIVCADELVAALTACVEKVTTTGQLGDGIVWVTEVEQATFLYKGG